MQSYWLSASRRWSWESVNWILLIEKKNLKKELLTCHKNLKMLSSTRIRDRCLDLFHKNREAPFVGTTTRFCLE